ncbi:hypothetical protein DXU03_29125 [Rhizobium johnstonii]
MLHYAITICLNGGEKMPAFFVWLIALFMIGAAIVSIICSFRDKSGQRLVLELGLLFLLAFALYLITGFPFPVSQNAFGSAYSVELALSLMFVAVILGIAASVVFHTDEQITVASFLKPLMVAPIVTLPLIGSLQGASLELVQLASITFLSFQNGFFWREVLKNVRVKTS